MSPKKSSRIGAGRPGGKRSIRPPRCAYSPVSRTVLARRKPLASSQRASSSSFTTLPGAAEKLSAATSFARRHALEQAIDRRGDDARALGRGSGAGEARERRHAPRDDAGMGRDAVIGLAVPAGNVEDFDFGIGEAQRLAERGRARRVARDMDEDRRPALGLARQRAGEIGAEEGVEALGRVGEEKLFALGEARARASPAPRRRPSVFARALLNGSVRRGCGRR